MPTSVIDRVRAALKRPSPTIPQLADALADARRADAEARAAIDKAQAVVTAGFLDAADKRQADRDALAKAREAAEDAGLVLAEVERRHAAILAADEQGRRRAVYDGAKAQADAAALALAKTYPRLAAGITAMLRDLATAQQAVAEANGQLPDGAEPIVDPELSARGVPGLPREVVSDAEIEAWGRFDLDVPVEERFQGEIYEAGAGWGKRGAYEMGSASMGEPQAAYRRRIFRKVVTKEPTNGEWPAPLAASLYLPSVRGSGALWGDSYAEHVNRMMLNDRGGADPAAVLARLADIDAAAVAKPVKAERVLRVEYPSHTDVVPLPERPMEQRAGQPSGTGSRFGASPFGRPGARAGGRR